jgi:hypothetical protein
MVWQPWPHTAVAWPLRQLGSELVLVPGPELVLAVALVGVAWTWLRRVAALAHLGPGTLTN